MVASSSEGSSTKALKGTVSTDILVAAGAVVVVVFIVAAEDCKVAGLCTGDVVGLFDLASVRAVTGVVDRRKAVEDDGIARVESAGCTAVEVRV